MMPRTEAVDTAHPDLDRYPSDALVTALLTDQAKAAEVARGAAGAIAAAVEAALPRIEAGGRLIYVGAGTSGRLGLIDSVELNPTFSWPRAKSVALLAGGEAAVRQAVEGAEDDADAGAEAIRAAGAGAQDVVLLIAASGATPFVAGALASARACGALTVALVCNRESPLARDADQAIVLDTGPELISGSTRLKAGTAQKIALNTFSSALMVRLGKVYRNLMVDLRPTNHKLRERAVRLTMQACGVDEAVARAALAAAGQQVKVAIVMLRRGVDAREAAALLAAAGGRVRAALGGT
jgi:N-acetylmuramic acid 6-phosphate etherase